MTSIGEVKTIMRFPFKSMGGESLREIYVHETGLNGDRVAAFYDSDHKRAGLPYFTAREKRTLLLASSRLFWEPNRWLPYPHSYVPEVWVELFGLTSLPEAYDTKDPRLVDRIKEVLQTDHELTVDHRLGGIHDNKPISIMGLATVQAIAEESEVTDLDPRRFRENFYVQWDDPTPFLEDKLVGRSLQIGPNLVVHVVKRNERCPIISTCPQTGEYDKRVLAKVVEQHEKCAGVYAMVRVPGRVEVGDRVIEL